MASALSTLKYYPGITDLSGDPLPDATLEFFLDTAANVILKHKYPFEEKATNELPDSYQWLQVRIAVDLIFKVGAEMQVKHVENTITREYVSAFVDPQLLSMITPRAGFPN